MDDLTPREPIAPPRSTKLPAAKRGAAKPGTAKPGTAKPARTARRSPLRLLGRITVIGLAVLLGGGLLAGAVAYRSYERIMADLPTVDGLRQYQPPVMSRIYAGNDHLIAELAKERRIFVPSSAIPDMLKQAFVSAEDQKFWTHHGVDPSAIMRAALTDLQYIGRNRRAIGASTITQQVARNMLLGTNERTLERKVKEAILAMRVEAVLPKERILELYLNEIYFGLQSYGVAAAAQTYFSKSLDALTLPEAAFLAALPKAPNNYNPSRFPEAARIRRDFVLDRMAEDHAITPEQAAEAKSGPVATAQFRRPETVPGAEWFGEDVRRQMVDRFGADATNQGGLVVRTSLNPALQATMDHVLRAGLLTYDRQHGGWRGPVTRLDTAGLRTGWQRALAGVAHPPGMLAEWRLAVVLDATADTARLGWADGAEPRTGTLALGELGWARPSHNGDLGASPRRIADVVQPGDVVMIEAPAPPSARAGRPMLRQIPHVQGAMVSLDPTTGRVLAMSGGWSFEASQFNRATQANRQPGSSFKPMVYLTAMEQGISPSQKVLDAPFSLDQGAAGVWRPGNYEKGFAGPISLHKALEKSLNLVTVRLAQQVGMQAVADNAIAFHVVDQMTHFLPNALGAVETTVMRQAGAYAALSQGGREVMPTLVDTVQDRDGHVIWRAPGLGCIGCTDPTRPPTLEDRRKSVADAPSVFQVVAMMEGVVLHGTGYEAGKGLGRPIAGKTGTSQDFNDAWFIGFTPDFVTAVWIGFDTPSSLGEGETGGAIAAPIWHDFMAVALRDHPALQFRVPEGVRLATWSGITDAFKPDQVPGQSEPTIGGGGGGGGRGHGGGQDTGGVTASSGGTGTGVDSGMGGLY